MKTFGPTFVPKEPTRKSLRKANAVPKPTTNIRHILLLVPTLARQKEKKRKLREQEQEDRQAIARFPQMKKIKFEPKECAKKKKSAIKRPSKTSPATPLRMISEAPVAVSPESAKSNTIKKEMKREGKADIKKSQVEEYRAPRRPLSTPDPETVQDSQPSSPPSITRSAAQNPAIDLAATRTPVIDLTMDYPPMRHMPLEQLAMEVACKRRITLLRRRKVALEALMIATDLPSLFAALRIVGELHDSSEFHPVAARLVEDAQMAGRGLLQQSLVERFTSPRAFGGLAFSDTKALLLIDHIFRILGPSLGTVHLTVEKLVSNGFPLMDSIEMLPHLGLIVSNIQDKTYALTQMVMSVTAEESLLTQRPYV
jgi:hypothetical protein